TTSVAGACLLWAVQIESFGKPYTMIGVSLGGVNQPSLADQVQEIVYSAADDFQELTLVTAGESMVRYETIWGEVIEAVTSNTLSTVSYGQAEILGTIQANSVQLV